MTVKELIKKLEKCNPYAKVYIDYTTESIDNNNRLVYEKEEEILTDLIEKHYIAGEVHLS